jgi:uncharacterized protein (TIGR02246 family)
MKDAFVVCLLLAAVCLCCSPPQTTESVTKGVNAEPEVEAVKALLAEIEKSWTTIDLDGFMKTIASDAVLMPPFSPALVGKDAIRAFFEEMFQEFAREVEVTTDEIEVIGKYAVHRGVWKNIHTVKEGDEPVVYVSSNFHMFKKQADGSWKWWRGMWNSDMPVTD